MQQYGEGPEPATLSGGNKRNWAAFEEHTDLPDEDAKKACTEWPEILETKAIPAISFSTWGSQFDFGGATHQTGTVNFGGGGIFQDLGPDCGDSPQTSTGPLCLPSLLWSECDTALPGLEMGKAAGYPNYDTITYSDDPAQLRFPSCTPTGMSWNLPDIEMKTEKILPIQHPDDMVLESESSICLGVSADDHKYTQTMFDQVASVLPPSATSQSVLPPAPDRQGPTSILISPNRRGEPHGSFPILEETPTSTHGGYVQIEPSSNSQKNPAQSNAAPGSTETAPIDASLDSEDLSDFATHDDIESDQMSPSQCNESKGC